MKKLTLLMAVAAIAMAVTVTQSQAQYFEFPRKVANKCDLVEVGEMGTFDLGGYPWGSKEAPGLFSGMTDGGVPFSGYGYLKGGRRGPTLVVISMTIGDCEFGNLRIKLPPRLSGGIDA